ncbi:MAG: IS630 family transposase, partial [Acidobacteria bacterium]|nr:IS630 family transposase [Acidobacteriota bacterium]
WLAKHKRFHMHFTPTSSSWLNMVERFFADLTNGCIRDGSFQSVRELIDAIEEFLAVRAEAPTPSKWKANGEDILRKITRARESLAAAIAG